MKTRLLLALTCALAALTSAFAEPVAIGHPGLAGEKIDAATLKSVFLGKKVAWDSAGRVTLAALKGGEVAEQFLKSVAEMSPSQFNNHWRRLAMTGGGSAPKFFEREEELRKFVAETPGAIGFLDRANADASVRIVP
jgi:ABC-type phosphate transport system substrate-binding protein